jgi:hypothetical protein
VCVCVYIGRESWAHLRSHTHMYVCIYTGRESGAHLRFGDGDLGLILGSTDQMQVYLDREYVGGLFRVVSGSLTSPKHIMSVCVYIHI